MIPQEEIKNELRQLIAEAMYMEVDEVLEEALFSDYGLESVTLVKILDKICEKYSLNLQIKDVLPYQTLVDSSGFIYERVLATHDQKEEV